MSATESMIREMARRRAWVEEVNQYAQGLASFPIARIIWPDVSNYYYVEGYNARETAIKYLEATHQGENS